MEVKGFLIFLALVFTMFKTDETVRKNLGFPPPPNKKGEVVVEGKKELQKKTINKFSMKSNGFVVCDNFDVTDCGVTLSHCINGEEKYECVPESEFKILEIPE